MQESSEEFVLGTACRLFESNVEGRDPKLTEINKCPSSLLVSVTTLAYKYRVILKDAVFAAFSKSAADANKYMPRNGYVLFMTYLTRHWKVLVSKHVQKAVEIRHLTFNTPLRLPRHS